MIDPTWLDDESVPASWLYSPDDDPGQDDEPAPSTAFADKVSPPAEPPWWLTDEFCGTPEEERAAWLASLPADIRTDYLDDPHAGADRDFAPGFSHLADGGPAGVGFAAGGTLDQMPPGPALARALAEAARLGYDNLDDSEQIGVLCGW